ncbi:type II toxin-antitoxin system VapC family toxin [Moraxella osloensis]|nr:type II toxin-antitoxin system VapC family toxin [Moraxella osloensis]MDK1670051.1 type II toxin-antitoxin system VapC family toxin [Moraxella osloensis]
MKYLLDTNTLIYYFKGLGNVKERLLVCQPSEIVLSSVVYYELQVGILKSTSPQKRIAQLAILKNQVSWVDFDEKSAEATAQVRVDLERIGKPIGSHDVQIAGMAVANDLILITHNTREFSRVNGLKLEDWF